MWLFWLQRPIKDLKSLISGQPPPDISLATFIRALVAIYLNVLDLDEKKSTQLESLIEQEVLKSLTNDQDKRSVNIQFKPKLLVELIAVAESLDVGISVLVEEVVVKLMATFTSGYPKSREFREGEIHGNLDMILMAV